MYFYHNAMAKILLLTDNGMNLIKIGSTIYLRRSYLDLSYLDLSLNMGFINFFFFIF